MKQGKKTKLSLHQPITYQITVPGTVDPHGAEWVEGMKVTYQNNNDSTFPTTVMTCTVDQAALHSLLRRLYGLGLPLISVICTACN